MFATILMLALSAFASSAATCNITDTTDYSNLTVALVRAAPPGFPPPILSRNYTGLHFDLNATVAYGVQLIEEAASNGANLVVFPELWFPGYPKGAGDEWIKTTAAEYIDNSLEIGSTHWNNLLTAAKTNSVYLALAFSEKTNSSIYMGQAIISKYGEILHHRQKLRPSGGERNIWNDGDINDIKAIDTPYGRWGILECWEHFHPSMTFPMQAQMENIHIASAPYTPDAKDPDAEYWETLEVNAAAIRTYAVNSGAVTLWAGVGYSAVYSGLGLEMAEVLAAVPYDEQPMLYSSINTTSFNKASYNANGEQSWSVLKQIEDGWPYYIPKVVGTFVTRKTVLISELVNFTGTA
ncbi:aliphatic nitrilase-like protein [Leptodontidium sp. MPI-SDFR-AT-0119]|nr:aliphatic nitrilase-like protein [Leptodontidium sp. MPI-SDFR-AT-0119]